MNREIKMPRARPSRAKRPTASVDRDRDRYQICLSKLIPIMDNVQLLTTKDKGSAKEKKLVDSIEKVHNEAGLKVFTETFFRMMVIPFQSKDSPFVGQLIEFFHDVVTDSRWDILDESILSPNSTVMSENSTANTSLLEEINGENLPHRMLRLCERYHSESRAIVRLRVMQTVARIIPACIKPSEIRKLMQIKVVKMLLQRIKDKSDPVRALAATVLSSFVGTSAPLQSQISQSLLQHMCYDPLATVRCNIVSLVPMNQEISVDRIVERCGDPNAEVRIAAMTRVTNDIRFGNLNADMKEAILKANSSEDNSKSVQAALNLMLKEWLDHVENDPCEFLKILDVRRRPKLCRTALDSLFNQSNQEAFDLIKKNLLQDKKYPEEGLCVEATYLWRYLFLRFKDDVYVYNKLVLDVPDMISYIKEYIEFVESEAELAEEDYNYRAWMLGDLLQILSLLPEEEGERKLILDYLPELFLKKKLMDIRNCNYGVHLISKCTNMTDETIVIELVNAVLDSDRPVKNLEKSEVVRELPPSPTTLKIQLGKLTHSKQKLESERDQAVKDNDMIKAHECQEQLKTLMDDMANLKENRALDTVSRSFNTSVSSDSQEEEDQWVYSEKTILIAMSTVKANIMYLNKVSHFCRTFNELYVMKAFTRSSTVIRGLALELMCIVALECEFEISKITVYCITALTKDEIHMKRIALKCLYDLVCRYSFAKLTSCEMVMQVLQELNSCKDIPKFAAEHSEPPTQLKNLLLSYIRHDDGCLVKISVTGVLKLLFKQEFNSSRIFVNFLMNWAVINYGDQIRFKDVPIMVSMYVMLGEPETIEIAHCLLQSIQKIVQKISASRQGQDPSIELIPDVDKVINLIVKATEPSRLTNLKRPYIGHETIANLALDEIRKLETTTEEKIQYVKLFKLLDLRLCPVESINQMVLTLADVAVTCNKTITGVLSGFSKYLESLIAHNRGGTGDNENETVVATGVGAGAFDDDSD